MNTVEESTSERLLQLEYFPLAEETQLEAYYLPLEKFPASEAETAAIKEFLTNFSRELGQGQGLSGELFLQLTDMNRPEGPKRISKNASRWMVEMGMGIWPDREPPAFFKKEDFTEIKPGEAPRNLMHQIMRVGADAPDRIHAVEGMAGLGAVLQMFVKEDWQSLQREMVNTLSAPITEELFLGFPFYVPLIEKKALGNKYASELKKWLCGASVYLREDVQDKCILIVSAIPLEKTFLRMNATRDPLSAGWTFPIPLANE